MHTEYLNEIWKDIKEYEGLYQVSNFGRVKSLDKIVRSGNRFNKNIDFAVKKGKILKQVDIGFGYLQVCLRKNNKNHSLYVHRLVWEAFNGPIPKGMEVNHINENKSDNRLENLNLLSKLENCNWETRNKRISLNQKQGKKIAMYSLAGDFEKEFYNIQEAMRFLKINGPSSNISSACSGKLKTAYRHLWKYI